MRTVSRDAESSERSAGPLSAGKSPDKPPNKPHAPQLPTPGERPDAEVVIYDGDCRFCTAQVRNIFRFDRGGRLAYLSLHDPEVARCYPDLTHDQLMADMYVIDRAGGRHAGAAGFRYLTRRLPLLWPLAPLMHIPFSLPLWQWGYRQIARRRYLFGKNPRCDDGACKVHLGK
jgi:predicted DCC family thiol-disulfide oxidoreductase YuxK